MNKLSKQDFQNRDDTRWMGMDKESFIADLYRHLHLTLGRDEGAETAHYLYTAVALTVRDRLVERWRESRTRRRREKHKRVAYLSMEYLMGRTLNNAVMNLDMGEQLQAALEELGVSLESVAEEERDAGLGNGGLGRLAACFLDSSATLGLPVTGYGLLYEFGMFQQKIVAGHQVEQPDYWLRNGDPWGFKAPEDHWIVKFNGRTETEIDNKGKPHVRWVETEDVMAIPYDLPIPGYRNDVVNTLRLWHAEATEEFNLQEFNAGSYTEAVAKKISAEEISKVLYPNDASEIGRALRLRQQYFLTSASLQDVLSLWVEQHGQNFSDFAAHHCFQLNDTHPAVAVAELMRLLVDDYALSWNESWAITTATMAYTNHTLLPEALECWPISLFEELLPRLLEIIREINARFIEQIKERWPDDVRRIEAMSIIEEHEHGQIRMAYLAVVGSFSVNGVAALHTELLTEGLFKDFHELWPHKFNNKTNGVTPRRWLAFCNPKLTALIDSRIGMNWRTVHEQLTQLKPLADDEAFRRQWYEVRHANKTRLAKQVLKKTGVKFEEHMLFDVQVKRFHEYKRQVLNVLHVIHRYNKIRAGDTAHLVPRCVLIGGKAAPGYFMAKLTIKLINNVAKVINADPTVAEYLRIAFLPNYTVTSMETICAGTDLSEQISTAGKEASGTGNMKFMMNGALTIGTLDGANIEIREAVGEENFFLFGLKANEVKQLRQNYDPESIIKSNVDLDLVMSMLETGFFDEGDTGIFAPLCNAIRDPADQWMTAVDFADYVSMQEQVDREFQNQDAWTRKSILNTAASGRFSSDRTIAEYASEIWRLE